MEAVENGEEVVLTELLEIATPEVSCIQYNKMDCHQIDLESGGYKAACVKFGTVACSLFYQELLPLFNI